MHRTAIAEIHDCCNSSLAIQKHTYEDVNITWLASAPVHMKVIIKNSYSTQKAYTSQQPHTRHNHVHIIYAAAQCSKQFTE